MKRLMHFWERKLSQRDTNRLVLPFEWGFEFLDTEHSLDSFFRWNFEKIESSNEFFRHTETDEYDQTGARLEFPSAVASPYSVNNRVRCRIFPAKQADGRAVIVLPQWNADAQSHVGLCKMISRFGMTALRLTLPYHEERNPSGPRADYLVSPNIGRTIQGIRQAVLDAKRAADWLQRQGYTSIGIMGTSVGSCIGFLTFVHDRRIAAGVFNHVSSFFAGVVWHGISTQHVRQGIEGHLTEQQLHRLWAVISPNSYVRKLNQQMRRPTLLISAKYDLTFPPNLAELLFEEHRLQGVPYEVSYLPCGHYTSAVAPFKYIDGFFIVRYLRKHLPRDQNQFEQFMESERET